MRKSGWLAEAGSSSDVVLQITKQLTLLIEAKCDPSSKAQVPLPVLWAIAARLLLLKWWYGRPDGITDRVIRLFRIMAVLITTRGGTKVVAPYPRIWALLKYLLPHHTRDKVYLPAIEDLKRDYFEAYSSETSKLAIWWLRFCFAFRTVLLLLDCFRAMGLCKLAFLIPRSLRRWWLGEYLPLK